MWWINPRFRDGVADKKKPLGHVMESELPVLDGKWVQKVRGQRNRKQWETCINPCYRWKTIRKKLCAMAERMGKVCNCTFEKREKFTLDPIVSYARQGEKRILGDTGRSMRAQKQKIGRWKFSKNGQDPILYFMEM